MKFTRRKAAMLLIGLVFAVSCGMLLRQAYFYQQGQNAYSEAAELVELPELSAGESVPAAYLPPTEESASPEESVPEEELVPAEEPLQEEKSPAVAAPEPETVTDPQAEALREIDFSALRETNEDVRGWIHIPDTKLSYPLMQGEDNDYYLNFTWQKYRNPVGSIFLDYRSSPDLSDFHTIIYGHRMNDESMFGQLWKYRDAAYLEEHPRIYIANDENSYIYEIFALYEAYSMSTYRLDFENDEDRRQFIDYCISRSETDIGIIPGEDDHIITLSTCTGRGHDTRWVIHAVRVN